MTKLYSDFEIYLEVVIQIYLLEVVVKTKKR